MRRSKIHFPATRFVFLVAIAFQAVLAAAQGQIPLTWKYSGTGACEAVAYSPDGSQIAVGGRGGVEIYSASTGTPLRGLISVVFEVKSLCFSPDGKSLLVGGVGIAGPSFQLWNSADGKLKANLPTDATTVSSCIRSVDGKLFVIGGTNGSQGIIEIWRASNFTRVLSIKSASTQINSVALSRDGKTLVDGGQDSKGGTLELRNASTGAIVSSLKTTADIVASVAISPDAKYLAAAGDGTSNLGAKLEVWDLTSNQLLYKLPTVVESETAVAFSLDGQTLISAGNTTERLGHSTFSNGKIEVWSISTGSLVNGSSFAEEQLALAVSPDGETLATAGTYSQDFPSLGYQHGVFYCVKPLSLSRVLFCITGHPYNGSPLPAPAISPDGKTVMSSSYAPTYFPASLWKSTDGTWLSQIGDSQTGQNPVFAYSPDGKTIAVGSTFNTGIVQIYDASTRNLLTTLSTGESDLLSLCYSSDSKRLAVGSLSSSSNADVINIWDFTKGAWLPTLVTAATGFNCSVVFSPDGQMLAFGGTILAASGDLELWNVSKANLITSLTTGAFDNLGVAISPDGKTLAVTGQNTYSTTSLPYGTLELWNIPSKKRTTVVSLLPYTTAVFTPIFARNGNMLFVGSDIGLQAIDTSSHKLAGYSPNGARYLAMSQDGTQLAFETIGNDLVVCPVPKFTSVEIASLTISPKSVMGGKSVTGTVTLAKPAPAGGATVGLFSSGGSSNVPPAVTVPAGTRLADFTVSTLVSQSQSTLTISAISGDFTKTSTLVVTPLPPKISGFALSTPVAVGGTSVLGTIELSSPVIGNNVLIALSSSDPAVHVPPSLIPSPGSINVKFYLATDPVDQLTKAKIVATLGTSTAYVQMTIQPAVLSRLSLNSTTITGGSNATLTIILTGPAGSKGTTVSLSSSNPAVVVPKTVSIPSGQSQVSVTVQTKSVTSQTAVTITGQAATVSQTTTLTVTPP